MRFHQLVAGVAANGSTSDEAFAALVAAAVAVSGPGDSAVQPASWGLVKGSGLPPQAPPDLPPNH